MNRRRALALTAGALLTLASLTACDNGGQCRSEAPVQVSRALIVEVPIIPHVEPVEPVVPHAIVPPVIPAHPSTACKETHS